MFFFFLNYLRNADKVYNIRNDISTHLSNDKPYIVNNAFQSRERLSDFSILPDNDIYDIFNSLNNKYCKLDPISAKLFKQCLPYLLPYVKYIMNSSLQSGTVPSRFKEALVKPKIKGNNLDQDLLHNF